MFTRGNPYTRFVSLRHPSPVYGPEKEGGSGGSGGTGAGAGTDSDGGDDDDSDPYSSVDGTFADEDENDDDDLGVDDDGRITDDSRSYLRDLFKSADDEGGDGDDTDDTDDGEQVREALSAELEDRLANMTLPEDLIPDDFNPSDPKALRALLNDVQRESARQALGMMFKPVQVTMERMAAQMNRQIRNAVNSGVGENNFNGMISQEIPAYKDPAVRRVIEPFITAAKKKHGSNHAAVIMAVKKGMQAVGMSISSNRRSGRSGSGSNSDGAGIRTGSAALDGFVRLPEIKRGSNSDRIRTKLTR